MRSFPSARQTSARQTDASSREVPGFGSTAAPPVRRARARRIVSASLATFMLLGLGMGSPALADDPLKQKQKQVQGQIAEAHDDLDHSSAEARKAAEALNKARSELAAAEAQLSAARAQVSQAQVKDQEMQAKLVAAEARLAKVTQQLKDGKADLGEQADQVADVVTNIYQQGDPKLRALGTMLSADNPADWARAMAVQDVVVQNETGTYDELRAAKVLLQVKKKSVKKAKEEVAAARAAAAAHLSQMQSLETAQQNATTLVADLVATRKSAQEAAASARAADQAMLKKLEAESAAISERLRQQALAAGASTNVPSAANTGGVLNKPVNGYVTSPFGYRTHPIYGYYSLHDGADFGAACGTPMYATEDGVVESSFWSDVYGNRMLLNHGLIKGVGLVSVYNHATSYVVSPGQEVKRGQLVGYVGTTGWSTGCHLHFTLLVNGDAVNPVDWF